MQEMALKNLFDAMKNEGYVIKDLDLYLAKKANEADENRAIDVNAPSQVGRCPRERYYARTQCVQADPNSISPRSQRIFDNGTGVHERLQGYLKDMGILLMDELPVHNVEYNIQGHTDGVLALTPLNEKGYTERIAILEIKSINDRGFGSLKEPKPEHKRQGLVYVYCAEQRRQELHRRYKNILQFKRSKTKRFAEYAELYQHLKGGSKYSREEKIQYQCQLHNLFDNILYRLKQPVTEAVFLYENKNTQDLKEFVISSKSKEAESLMTEILNDYKSLNDYIAKGEVPPRIASKKTDDCCRWCNYRIACWN